MRDWFFICITTIFLLLLSERVSCQTFQFNGSATTLGGNCYQITPDASTLAGSMFSLNTIDLTQPFNLDARLFFGCKDGNGADGIVFILGTSNSALGSGGGGIGYQGISPSIAVEMDDYQNGNFGDPASDHISIVSMGNIDHTQPTNLAGPNNLPNIEDCMEHCFYVNWNPLTQTLTATLDDETISYTGDIVNTIFSGTTQVYFGFSAGTGGLSNIHRVCFGPPTLEPMADISICEGESVDLQADENGIAWQWTPHPTLTPLNVSDPTASPLVTTTYSTRIEYLCGYFHNDTVVVNVIAEPVANASNNGPVCVGETAQLMSSGGTSYEWEGPQGYSSSLQNPVINNIAINMGGVYFVTVTDAAGCTAVATTEIEIDLGPDIEIEPPSSLLCINDGDIQLTADPAGGIWSGDITPSGVFDPSYVGEGFHQITYTATNANGCSNSETISIEVFGIPDVVINSPGILCEDGDPVQLTGTPAGGFWSGEISINGLFDPVDAGQGIHVITYTANDGNGCTNSEEILIEVVQDITVNITPEGPFCSSDGIVMLTATPLGGMWGGVADATGNINTTLLGPGTYLVTYGATNGCYSGEITIEITDHPNVSINGIVPLCPDVSPQQLTASPQGGIWGGAASSNGIIDPSLLGPGLHNVFYTFQLPNGCTSTDTFALEILPSPPQIANLNTTCDSLAAFYVVSFTISGGDPSTYNITGSTMGTVVAGNPTLFFSEPIPSGSTYDFAVNDNNFCGTSSIMGAFTCNCATNAGMMNLNAITLCEGQSVTASLPIGVVLDTDDTLVYALHQGFPGNIIFMSPTNTFQFNPPLVTGTTYFISSVVGNVLPGGSIDLGDPCLSVSFGTPVSWVENPSGHLTSDSPICKGESATLVFTLTGDDPFDLFYSDGTNIFSLNNIISGHTVNVSPDTTTEYRLLQATSLSAPGCSNVIDTSVTIEVIEISPTDQIAFICNGDSIFLGNEFQNENGVYYDTLSSINGCDSIIITALTVNVTDTTYTTDSSCDPLMTGVFTVNATNQFGCDSTIMLTVVFAEEDTTYIQSSTCDPGSSGVFTDVYLALDGCDSLVIETVLLLPSDTITISSETCIEENAGTFTMTLSNVFGCDSLIIETVTHIPSDTTFITGETCDAASAGTFNTILSNANGCDSIIIETIQLLETDTLIDQSTTCNALDTGIQILTFTNVNGCDSLIITYTMLAPFDSCNVVVISKDVFIPNIFTPDGDGFNDVFLVFTNPAAGAKIGFLRIFDRWGGLVFEKQDINPNDPLSGWDGIHNGKAVNPGVYAYAVQLIYPSGEQEILTGDITILR